MTDVKLKPLYPHMAHRNKQIITPNAGKSATGKIRVRQVTSDVACAYPRLPEKENKRDTQCLL